MNKIVLLGRLLHDPEMKVLEESGKVVTKFVLIVERNFRTSNGEREADFIPITLWGKKAEVASQFLVKGSKITASGRLQTRSYEDKDGNRRVAFEVVAEEFQFVDSQKHEDDAV
jgi:single-strand DNA-binding protein